PVADLATAARTDEATQLVGRGSAALSGLLLHDPKRCELALGRDHAFDAIDPERADHLVFEIAIADEETELLQSVSREIAPVPGACEASAQRRLFTGVAETPDVQIASVRPVLLEVSRDVRRTADGDDRETVVIDVDPVPPSERAEGSAVAESLDEDNHTGGVDDGIHGVSITCATLG